MGSPASGGGDGTGLPFVRLLFCCVWRRGFCESIPGIGVPPGFIATLAFLASGTSGVGVTSRVALATMGVAGVELPAGRLLALTACIVARLAFAALEFVSAPPPQAAASNAKAAVAVISDFLLIIILNMQI